MPQNKRQEVIFAGMMSFFMILGMEFYNGSLQLGAWTTEVFGLMASEIRLMLPLCFFISFFVVEKRVQSLSVRMVTPGKDHPVFVTLVRAGIAVSFMCPIMSLCATLIFQGISVNIINQWLGTVIRNFPMAFFWQICYCGLLVRCLFRKLFAGTAQKQTSERTDSAEMG